MISKKHEYSMSTKMDALGEYKRSHATGYQIARKLGVPQGAVLCWIQKYDSMVKDWLECVRLADEGKLQAFLPEAPRVTDDERKIITDYKREIAYLKARLAYYEEISKECGIDFLDVSKKNDIGQSNDVSTETKET